jgi:hypothetical protein
LNLAPPIRSFGDIDAINVVEHCETPLVLPLSAVSVSVVSVENSLRVSGTSAEWSL